MFPGVASLPAGWAHLEPIELQTEILQSVRTLKAVPFCIRSSFARIQTQVLARLHSTQAARERTMPSDPAWQAHEMAQALHGSCFCFCPECCCSLQLVAAMQVSGT